MKTAVTRLKSLSPYSQSKYIDEPMLDRELPDAYMRRTWRLHLHVTPQGYVEIPPMALKNCLSMAAKYLSIQVKGKGKATYTKNFEAGVMVIEPIVLPIRMEDVESDTLFLPSDGIRGSGKRVTKIYPRINSWEGDATWLILDDIIDEDIFMHILEQSGQLIGIGRFRPRNSGYYGRFSAKLISWQ